MIKLIVGLGNPGAQYDRTPHNAGFEVVDRIAKRANAAWTLDRRCEAMVATTTYPLPAATLMKPMTFMNLSGRSVGNFCRRNGVEPEQVLIISDEIHLDLGRLRIRPDGSHGGQKGLLSIIQTLGSMSIPRLRVGVRPEGSGQIHDWSKFVLSRFRPDDFTIYQQVLEDAADCVERILKEADLLGAMNQYNAKK